VRKTSSQSSSYPSGKRYVVSTAFDPAVAGYADVDRLLRTEPQVQLTNPPVLNNHSNDFKSHTALRLCGNWRSTLGLACLFRRLKAFRRTFSRFAKLDALLLGFLNFARIVEALRLVGTRGQAAAQTACNGD
jgi:hypothetical protein